MRRFSRFVSLVAVTLLLASCARPYRPPVRPPLPPPPPRPVTELRGVWVSDTTRLNWDEATAALQRAGFNTMYVNLASSGARFYLDGAADPVARGIELAHRRGLAVHAKIIVMFMFKAPAQFQRELVKAGRVMLGEDRRPLLQSGNAWLCPSQPANRMLVKAALADVLQRYRVDGVQFDYIRFNEQPSCFCPLCRLHNNEWRKQVINEWIRDLSATVRQWRPGMPVSAAVFSDLDRAREEKAQDWKLWLERGDVDYVCTMSYVTDPWQFEALVRKQQAWAPRRRQIVVGIGSWKMDRRSQLTAQIEITRRFGAAGFALFSYDDCAARDFLPSLR